MPEAPTVEEFVPGVTFMSWLGYAMAPKTPPAIVERMNAEVRRALSLPDVQSKLVDGGNLATPSTPDEFLSTFHPDGEIAVSWFRGPFAEFVEHCKRGGMSKHLIMAPLVAGQRRPRDRRDHDHHHRAAGDRRSGRRHDLAGALPRPARTPRRRMESARARRGLRTGPARSGGAVGRLCAHDARRRMRRSIPSPTAIWRCGSRRPAGRWRSRCTTTAPPHTQALVDRYRQWLAGQ